jgi:hypothetical protein
VCRLADALIEIYLLELGKMTMKNKLAGRRAARFESLEVRKMLVASLPVDLIAIADDGTQQGDTPRAVRFYDVDDITNAGATGTAFSKPLFSIWTGYEVTIETFTQAARNFEDFVSIAFSSDGETGYMLAFDSITGGTVTTTDSVGDTFGDYDLYRFNVLAAYNDYVTNNREPGVLYAPRYSPDYNTGLGTGIDYIGTYGATLGPTGLPAVTSLNDGVPKLEGGASSTIIRDNTDSIKSNDIVFLDGVSAKVGEVARYTGASNPSIGFINEQEIQVVDDETLLLSERPRLNPSLSGGAADDWSIRTIERVSTSPGAAVFNATAETGGSNGNTTESWEAFAWSGDNFIAMDPVTTPGSFPVSDFDGMRYVERDGTKGVWISDRDGGGDDLSFFALNFDTRVAAKQEQQVGPSPFAKSFALDEDPEVSTTTNDGDLDGFDLDLNGNLVIRESDFLSVPKAEPKFITRAVASYNAGDSDLNSIGEITFGAWDTKTRLISTVDDDADPLNTLNAVYSASQNLMYIFDIDSGTGAAVDVYVYDMTAETIIYTQMDFSNPLLRDGNRIRALRLGAVVDTVAPTVNLAWNYLTEQSVTLTFSEDVSASLTVADLVLTNTTTATVIPTADLTLTSLGGNVYKLTYKTGAATTPLPKGAYTLSVTPAGVTDAAGNALAGTNSVAFKVLPGDANNDGTVNFNDLLTLAQNYNLSGKDFSTGNFDYDAAGLVNFNDLLLLAQNYNTSVLTAAPTATASLKSGALATKRKPISADVL